MSIWPEPRNLHQKVGNEKDTGGKATLYVGVDDVMPFIMAVVMRISCIQSLTFYILMLTSFWHKYTFKLQI